MSETTTGMQCAEDPAATEHSAPVKIAQLEIENYQRTKKVHLVLTDGLNIIGGRNHQGKTSVLNAIAAALGGARRVVDNPINNEAKLADKRTVACTSVELSNGILAKRGFTVKNDRGNLVVKLPSGRDGNQSDLDEVVSSFALNASQFFRGTDRDRTDMFLRTLGVDLEPLQKRYQDVYAERTKTWQLKEDTKGHADDLPSWEDVPAQELSASEVTKRLQDAMDHNQSVKLEKQDLLTGSEKVKQAQRHIDNCTQEHEDAARKVVELKRQLKAAEEHQAACEANVKQAIDAKAATEASHAENAQRVANLTEIDTEPIKKQLSEIEDTNRKVRDNITKSQKYREAESYMSTYREQTEQLDDIRKQMAAMLPPTMPVPGMALDLDRMILTYAGETWDGMSHSQQLIMATAIARLDNPKCGFVTVDKLEALDVDTLMKFGAWAHSEGLQVIGTRVSTNADGECQFVITDGSVQE